MAAEKPLLFYGMPVKGIICQILYRNNRAKALHLKLAFPE